MVDVSTFCIYVRDYLINDYKWVFEEANTFVHSHSNTVDSLFTKNYSCAEAAWQINDTKRKIELERAHDLLNATYAYDEFAMAKIVDRMSNDEIAELRLHLIALTNLLDTREYNVKLG